MKKGLREVPVGKKTGGGTVGVRLQWKERQPIDVLDRKGAHFRDAEHHTPGTAVTGTAREEVVAT